MCVYVHVYVCVCVCVCVCVFVRMCLGLCNMFTVYGEAKMTYSWNIKIAYSSKKADWSLKGKRHYDHRYYHMHM